MIEEIVANSTAKEIDQAFADYADIGAFLDKGIQQQAGFNIESFIRSTGRDLPKSEKEQVHDAMLKGMRWTYLGSGMTHPNFLATVEAIKPEARSEIEGMAGAFC